MFVKTIGGCMRPLIKIGDIVYIKEDYFDVSCGDIVLYEVDGQKFLHRIVKENKDSYVVCDDVGITLPIKIRKNSVIGVYPTIMGGFVGLFYHRVVRSMFQLLREVKHIKLI